MICREDIKLGDRLNASVAAFRGGTVLLGAIAQGIGLDLHMEADVARRLGQLLIELADLSQPARQAVRVAA